MARIILIYGVIGGLIVAGLGRTVMAIFPLEISLRAMAIGYLTMLIALSTVLVGTKQYRDQARGGVITFKEAFLVGLGIAALATLFYAINFEIYLVTGGENFYPTYEAAMVEKAREAGLTGQALQAAITQAANDRAAYENPMIRIPMTYFLEMFPVGLLVSLVSAFLLRNPRFLPARDPISAAA